MSAIHHVALLGFSVQQVDRLELAAVFRDLAALVLHVSNGVEILHHVLRAMRTTLRCALGTSRHHRRPVRQAPFSVLRWPLPPVSPCWLRYMQGEHCCHQHD